MSLKKENIFIHLFFVIFCLSFIIPFLYIISASLTSDTELLNSGYKIFPKEIATNAYAQIFKNPVQIITSYKVTIFYSIVGTFLSIIVMALVAYPISRNTFKHRRFVTFFIYFTMLFNGGLVPTYILVTQYLKLGNNIWVYILPTLASAYYIIIFRTFFQNLPIALVESCKIDGASELRIFFQIILPLSKPVLATVALLTLLAKWNDWYTSLIYIRSKELYSVQFLLQKIMREIDFLNSIAKDPTMGGDMVALNLPKESIKYAMVIIAAGPMLMVFPFFQKYFTQGLTVGAIKG